MNFKIKTLEEKLQEQAQQIIDKKVAEAKQYLASTDFKMTTDYDEDVSDIKVKRAEAREFIRANS